MQTLVVQKTVQGSREELARGCAEQKRKHPEILPGRVRNIRNCRGELEAQMQNLSGKKKIHQIASGNE